MKALKDAQKRQALKGNTVGGGSGLKKRSASASATAAIGSGKAKKGAASSADADAEIKFQPHRDVIDAGKIVRELGDHINTRYADHDDLDQLDAGLGLNHDSEGAAMIEEARMAAGDRRQAIIGDVRAHLFGRAAASSSADLLPPHIDSKIAFIGHNRNTVTCCTVLDMTIFYGDKTGHVFRCEANSAFNRSADSKLTSSSSAAQQQQQEYFYHRIAMNPKHKGAVLSLAISDTRGNRPANWGKERSSVDMSVLNYLVSGGQDGAIHVWKAVSGDYVGILKMHRGPVTGLCFRQWSSMLVSASADTTIRLWSVPEMHCEDKFYGHNGPVNGISSLRKERCATAGADRTIRHWKLDAATQVEFSTDGAAAECVAMIDDIHLVAGTANGQLMLFDTNKRFAIQTISQPHGVGSVGDGTGLEMLEGSPSPIAAARGNAITAIAALPYGDLVATASYNGTIALWHFAGAAATNNSAHAKAPIGDKKKSDAPRPTNRLSLVATFPCKGCVNSLQFSPDGSVLIGSVGKDQRTGRWLTISAALNGVVVIPLHKKGEEEVSAVTQTSQINAGSASAAAASSNKAARKMTEPLVQDPSHYPLTEEAKMEARRKKRKEILERRKASREAQQALNAKRRREEEGEDEDEDEDGDAIDQWGADESAAAPSKKKAVAEKKKKKAAVEKVVVPTIVPQDDEDDEDDNNSDDDDDADSMAGAPDAFKLGKDGQFVFGGSDDEDGSDDDSFTGMPNDFSDDEEVAAPKAKKGGAAMKKKGGAAAAPAKKAGKVLRKSDGAAGGKKKVLGKKRK